MHVQHSLTSFTDMNDSTELLPMDEFEDLTTVKIESKPKVNAQKGRKERKRTSSSRPSIDSNNEEKIDSFPQTTSASTAPLRNTRRRTTRAPPPPSRHASHSVCLCSRLHEQRSQGTTPSPATKQRGRWVPPHCQ